MWSVATTSCGHRPQSPPLWHFGDSDRVFKTSPVVPPPSPRPCQHIHPSRNLMQRCFEPGPHLEVPASLKLDGCVEPARAGTQAAGEGSGCGSVGHGRAGQASPTLQALKSCSLTPGTIMALLRVALCIAYAVGVLAEARPRVILHLLIDDLGWADVGESLEVLLHRPLPGRVCMCGRSLSVRSLLLLSGSLPTDLNSAAVVFLQVFTTTTRPSTQKCRRRIWTVWSRRASS